MKWTENGMSLAWKFVQCCFDCRRYCACKRTSGNCTCNCLPWAGHPVLPVSIADVNYLSCKGGFTRWAKAGDNNQQTADEVKTAIPRPFTRTKKGYYFSVIRCWRKRSAKSMSVPMQNRSNFFPKTMIIIMTKKKKNISVLWNCS